MPTPGAPQLDPHGRCIIDIHGRPNVTGADGACCCIDEPPPCTPWCLPIGCSLAAHTVQVPVQFQWGMQSDQPYSALITIDPFQIPLVRSPLPGNPECSYTYTGQNDILGDGVISEPPVIVSDFGGQQSGTIVSGVVSASIAQSPCECDYRWVLSVGFAFEIIPETLGEIVFFYNGFGSFKIIPVPVPIPPTGQCPPSLSLYRPGGPYTLMFCPPPGTNFCGEHNCTNVVGVVVVPQ